MKIIFLNCWNGKLKKSLFNFIKEVRDTTDIFSFQETKEDINSEIFELLPNFLNVESHKNVGVRRNYDISVFISNNLNILDTQINNISDQNIGDFSIISLKNFSVCVVHGVAQPGDKNDSPDRIKQSELIIEAMNKIKTFKIIGGDFNLNPDTESIKMFQKEGYRSLIEEFKVKSTRNHYSWEQAETQAKTLGLKFFGRQMFADYCFVSKDIKVKNFTVPDVEISDHLPLILEFEV